jgi:hypothetical protein
MTTNDQPPNVSSLSVDELLALRTAIDAQLDEKRNALLTEAGRLGRVIANGKKRAGRKTTALPDE